MSGDDSDCSTSWSGKPWQRFYLGYNERFVDDCYIELHGGRVRVRLAQAPSAKCAGKKLGVTLDKNSDPALTGTTVWDGAVVLSQYLTTTDVLRRRSYPSGCELPNCLELGAGTGAVSLSLLACGCLSSATVTDIPDVLPFLTHNISLNQHLFRRSIVHIQPLRWAVEDDVKHLKPRAPPFDLIVGSDLIYYSYSEATPHTKLLLTTLKRLSCPGTIILLALSLHHNAEEVEHFLTLATEDFNVERVTHKVPDPWRVPDVMVVELTLQQQSTAAIEQPHDY